MAISASIIKRQIPEIHYNVIRSIRKEIDIFEEDGVSIFIFTNNSTDKRFLILKQLKRVLCIEIK